MGFHKNIDAPGNRRDRRAVAVIQRKAGAEGRIAAAQAKRQRRMAREFGRDLDKTIVFYNQPVSLQDPDGAYLSPAVDGQRQVIIAGEPKASIDHYVNATGVFLKTPMRLVSETPMTVFSSRPFLSLVLEPIA